jgi:hypothetical protein
MRPEPATIHAPNDPSENARGPLVYVVEVMINGRRLTKIGYTGGLLHSRIATLQTATPGRIVVRGWVRGPMEIERKFHSIASQSWERTCGEWFDSTDDPCHLDDLLLIRAYSCLQDVEDRVDAAFDEMYAYSYPRFSITSTNEAAHKAILERQQANK